MMLKINQEKKQRGAIVTKMLKRHLPDYFVKKFCECTTYHMRNILLNLRLSVI